MIKHLPNYSTDLVFHLTVLNSPVSQIKHHMCMNAENIPLNKYVVDVHNWNMKYIKPRMILYVCGMKSGQLIQPR